MAQINPNLPAVGGDIGTWGTKLTTALGQIVTQGNSTDAAITGMPEVIRDTMGTALVAGTGMRIDVDDPGDKITISATSTGGGSYTDEQAQDAAASLFLGGTHTGINFTYDDTGNRINANVTATGGTGGSGTPFGIVNVKDYGATGLESQDATTAVKNAIAAVANRNIGGVKAGIVYFPAGIYVVNEALSIPKNIILKGEHQFVTMLRLYTNIGATPFITFGIDGQISTGTAIENMTIDAETNSQVAVRMYGPQEGSYLRRCLISGATLRTVEIRGANTEGSTNKFKVEDCWIWVNNDSGMCGLWFNGTTGPLAVRDTTIVGINRSGTYALNNGSNGGGPAGSAGIIIADGGALIIDDVNVERFESHTNAKSTTLDFRTPSSFFCTYGITVNTSNTPIRITNAIFDNVTAGFRNTATGKTVPFFVNYVGEAYQSDRRSFLDNQWSLGSAGIYSGTADRETQLGYGVYGNADANRFKINTIKPGGNGWNEVANVDDSMTFGTGSAAWNGAHLRLGAFHLWVDGANRLRLKSSVPTSDTDGTIVGTQS